MLFPANSRGPPCGSAGTRRREGPLKIRTAQVEAFDEIRMPEFEDSMVEHLGSFTPLHARALGDQGLRKLIRLGLERAARHGFRRRSLVRFYIETMVLIGAEFDTDPQFAGATEILGDRTTPDPMDRGDRLHDWLMDYLDRVAGPGRSRAIEAFRRVRAMPFDPVSLTDVDYDAKVIARMKENHPEKVQYVGEESLRRLVRRAFEEADRWSIRTDGGLFVVLGLMFAAGHGVLRDPKYPWIESTLANPNIRGTDKRVERVYSKTMTYLDSVLQHIEER